MEFFKELFKNMNGKQQTAVAAIILNSTIAIANVALVFAANSDKINFKHGDNYLKLASSNDDTQDTGEE